MVPKCVCTQTRYKVIGYGQICHPRIFPMSLSEGEVGAGGGQRSEAPEEPESPQTKQREEPTDSQIVYRRLLEDERNTINERRDARGKDSVRRRGRLIKLSGFCCSFKKQDHEVLMQRHRYLVVQFSRIRLDEGSEAKACSWSDRLVPVTSSCLS
ncbi:hypothetical protein F2P81_015386 [Scophthalmus maximus]|uniref:Uncharacterized protein n=1 Tax=Scophthalmus maximus TaxID=52904 RepID=A0A6A4SD74_SCOMX|nr:hypothetical protein F2P81_015386 [Scophthalmus maximus]